MANHIQKAIESLQPISFEPHYIAYFVLKDGCDLGGEDYCINCIQEAVDAAKRDNAVYSYEGHDPDFSGGCHEPNCCSNCGDPFQTEFTANEEEAKHLLRLVSKKNITDRDKWELEIALYHYQYSKPKVKNILARIASKLLNP